MATNIDTLELELDDDDLELELELELDKEACPGCGCKPGDGLTAGCEHPGGCGENRKREAEARA